MPMPKITTLGINMPVEFPITPYETIHAIIAPPRSKDPLYQHYAGAWNALAIRFRAAFEYGDNFVESFKAHGAVPPPEERYDQEKMLFNFFNSGFSVIESTFYALYVIGAFLKPGDFPLTTMKNQKDVSPQSTERVFAKSFPKDPILSTFQQLFSDQEYIQWRDYRNILTHRTAPGRLIQVSVGKNPPHPTIWKLNNKPFDDSIAIEGKKELTRLLTKLLEASEIFVKREF